MRNIKLFFKYINYLFSAKGISGVHSPFLGKFLEQVLYAKTDKSKLTDIENQRKKLLKDQSTINIKDFGAGSKVSGAKKRKIKSIAKHTLKSQKYSHLIYRIISHFKPESILELGTSLGISTLYMSEANSNAEIVTVEGCLETANIAKGIFHKFKATNIIVENTDFDSFLPNYFDKHESVDMVFFDGNHRKEATINYFELCLRKKNSKTIFIFDDIRWSDEMEEAWEYIQEHSQTNVCVDLFFMGIVFFKDELSKEKFVIKF